MTNVKLSQIAPSPSPADVTTQLVAVQGGNTDYLFNLSQIINGLGLLRSTVADQTLSGGWNVTAHTYTTGNVAIDCGQGPLQLINNAGAFTITAPGNDGSTILQVTNVTGAGVITFSGFATTTGTGDTLTTTVGNRFSIAIWRINGISSYFVYANQNAGFFNTAYTAAIATTTGAGTNVTNAPNTARADINRWTDVFNVLDFGADPTFTNDSSPAIQAALNAACAASSTNTYRGGTIFFPPGKYKMNSQVTGPSGLTTNPNITLQGSGGGTGGGNTLLQAGSPFTGTYMIAGSSSQTFQAATRSAIAFVKDLNFAVGSGNPGVSCLQLGNTNNAAVYRCRFSAGSNAIGVDFSGGNIFSGGVFSCSFAGGGQTDGSIGVLGLIGGGVYQCRFQGCGTAINTNGDGTTNGRFTAYGQAIIGCTIETCGVGVNAVSSNSILISALETESNINHIKINSGGGHISNCVLTGPSGNGSRGIWVTGGTCVITACVISAPFSIAGVDESALIGNSVVNISNVVANSSQAPGAVNWKYPTAFSTTNAAVQNLGNNSVTPIPSVTFANLPVAGYPGGASGALTIGSEYWISDSLVPPVSTGASFTGAITGTTASVSAISSGLLTPGDTIQAFSGSGVTAGSVIRAQLSGSVGSLGTYALSTASTVASPIAMTAYYKNFGTQLTAGGGTNTVKIRVASLPSATQAFLSDNTTNAIFWGTVGAQFTGSVTGGVLNVTAWLNQQQVTATITGASGSTATLNITAWNGQCQFTGSISGTAASNALDITAIASGSTSVGMFIDDGAANLTAPGTRLRTVAVAPAGVLQEWVIDITQTVASETMYGIPCLGASGLGPTPLPQVGMFVGDGGVNVPAGTVITIVTSPWNGVSGTYQLGNVNGTSLANVGSETMYIFTGILSALDTVTGTGISAGTTVSPGGVTSAWNGVSGTYALSGTTTAASASLTGSSNVLSVTNLISGTISTTMLFNAAGAGSNAANVIGANRTINSQASGNANGTGTYIFSGTPVSGSGMNGASFVTPTPIGNTPVTTAALPTSTGLFIMGAGFAGTVLTMPSSGTVTGTFATNMVGQFRGDGNGAHRYILTTQIDSTHWNVSGSSLYFPPDVFQGALWEIA